MCEQTVGGIVLTDTKTRLKNITKKEQELREIEQILIERTQIQTALLKLNSSTQGRKILKGAGMTGLIKASEQEYDIHRSMIFDVLKERY